VLRFLKWLIALALTAGVAVGAVVLLTAYDELTKTLPPIDRLLDYEPPVATRVYAADGSLIEEFFRERRYRVPIADIPPLVRNAFLAAEDSDFFAHRGVDFLGITRAFLVNLRAGDVVQGASTITQQVVKALLLSPERSYERKVKEILLSFRLEQHLSKEQILELYLNQIYLGDGNHGVGAAARNYFGKSVQDLTAAEAAMLAGLPAAPSRYSPSRDPAAARKRQLYVLRRMLEERFLSAGEYQAAMRESVQVLSRRQKPSAVRNYYTEAVRLQLEDMFGAEAPYNQGYSVYTTMQPRLQALAEAAVRNGIERTDWALGYRGPVAHVSGGDDTAKRIARAKSDMPGGRPDPERLYEAVVTKVATGRLDIVVGPWTTTVDTAPVRWSSTVRSRSFRVGDVVEVRSRELAHSGEKKDTEGDPRFWIAQTPEVEAALVAIDTDDGGVAALVGGYDFLASQFNRALQARRQPGSAFKPFVYAAALDNGYTAASILMDTPVEYMDHDKVWAPRNYTRDFKGPIRLRTALEQSRNVVSVKLVNSVGVKTVVDYLSRFHFQAKFGPNLSIGLGTTELTLRDLTEGYTAFANGGVMVEPVVIRRIADKSGEAFFTDEARRREALSPATAAVMTYILEGVIERGTATTVKAIDRPVAGKTGTTNDQRDAWFVGYTPNLVVGVWIGFDDQNKTMGKMGTGGRVAAPIWMDFMKPALAGTKVRDFEIPDDISCVNIDPWSGKRAGEWTSKPLLECFKAGTEPGVGSRSEPDAGGDSTATSGASTPSDTSLVGASPSDAAREAAPADPRFPSPADPDRGAGRPDPRYAEPAPLYPYKPPSRREAPPPDDEDPLLDFGEAPRAEPDREPERLWSPPPSDGQR
jgi:penicillin-binding protein 1A